jgi:ribosomal protein L13E/predicted flap endonuclease-1-like 5' DNA nuclease
MSHNAEKSQNSAERTTPVVTRPKRYQKNRQGRGFSLKEIKSAAIPFDDAKKLDIPIDERRKSVHDENVQMLSSLYRQTVSTRTEAKIELDKSTKDAFKELKALKGIKGNEAKLMIEAGVKSLKTLIEENPKSLAGDTKIEIEKIEKWIAMAKVLLKRKEVADSMTELMQIRGMNRTYAQRLIDFGILTLNDLSRETAAILAKDLKVSEDLLEVWIDDSKRLTGQITTPTKKVKAKKEKPAEELEEVEEKPKAKPAKKLKEKPAKKPKEKPAEEPKEELPEKPAKKPKEKPAEEPKEELPEKPAKKPKEKPAEEPKEELPEKPAKKPKEKPAEEPKEELPEKPAEALPEIPKEEIAQVLKEKLPELPKEKPSVEPAIEAKKPLTLADLKGLGKGELKKLKELDITKIEDLVEEDADELSTMTGINKATIQQWIGDIREYLGLPREQEKPKPAETPAAAAKIEEDPLSKWLKIEGVGKKNAEKLVKAGILDIKELLEGDLKDLSKKSKVSDKDLKKIVESFQKKAPK